MYHIMYTKGGIFHQAEMSFPSFAEAEKWVRSQGATYWEIGFYPTIIESAVR